MVCFDDSLEHLQATVTGVIVLQVITTVAVIHAA